MSRWEFRVSSLPLTVSGQLVHFSNEHWWQLVLPKHFFLIMYMFWRRKHYYSEKHIQGSSTLKSKTKKSLVWLDVWLFYSCLKRLSFDLALSAPPLTAVSHHSHNKPCLSSSPLRSSPPLSLPLPQLMALPLPQLMALLLPQLMTLLLRHTPFKTQHKRESPNKYPRWPSKRRFHRSLIERMVHRIRIWT
jgi:hypothetical protein